MLRRLRGLALALAAGLTGGCASSVATWNPVMATPEVLTDAGSGPLRVTRLDGTRVILYRAEVDGDTLRGWSDALGMLGPVRIAFRDLRSVEAQGQATARTGRPMDTWLVVGVAGVLAVALLQALQSWPFRHL